MSDTVIIPFTLLFPEPNLKVLGLQLENRLLLTAKKAGFKNIFFLKNGEKLTHVPEEFLVVFPNVLLSMSTWGNLRQFVSTQEALYDSDLTDSVFLVRTKDGKRVLDILQECRVPSEILKKIKSFLKVFPLPLREEDRITLESEKDMNSVERWFLQSLIKASEGFMSKHLERKISLSITRKIVNYSITPNWMTGISVLVGIIGAFFFIFPWKWYHVVGAILFWMHSVLDGCDGEIARLKFLESRWGGILDFWSDNIVHSAVFTAIAYGLWKSEGTQIPLVLGFWAVVGTLFSAGFVYWTTMKIKKDKGPLFTSVISQTESCPILFGTVQPMKKAVDFLARRDFIYLVILLAFFGKIEWFLWMGAIGAPTYFLVLLWFSAKKIKNAK